MRQLTVLVVDDDPGNRMVVTAALSGGGFDVRCAHDAAAARVALEEVAVDVLLLDVMMPGESGIDMCRALRSDPAWERLPIVMMTALDAGRHRVDALETGADDWIDKPVDLDDLQRTVQRWGMLGRGSQGRL